MAEIIRRMHSLEARFTYPMRELNEISQKAVYEAVGNYLDKQIIEEAKEISAGAFLVRLHNEQEVAFEFDVVRFLHKDVDKTYTQ